MEYQALVLQQYRTDGPVPRFERFSATSHDEAVTIAVALIGPMEKRYGAWLHSVVLLEDGAPKILIFDGEQQVCMPAGGSAHLAAFSAVKKLERVELSPFYFPAPQ